jgi:serine/threonine protein kinase
MADQAEADQLVGGRYRLVAELGSDRRWRAHDERSDTEVTVERVRLPSARAAAERAALFEHGRAEREPRQATALRTNANLVFVEDVVADEDVLWRVTRLVEGRTLADDVSAYGPLDAEAAERIAIDVVAALAAAHQAGIAHGDLSPAAVLLTGTGDALLTGFDADETLAGASVYHAPERKRGEEPRPPGDLFSLGATLYFAVEGDPPIRGGTPETSGAARSEEVAAAEHADGLWPLITRLLAKDPAARPTAREVRALLEPPPAAPAEARDHPDLPPKPGAVPPSKPDRSAMTTTIVIVLLLGAVLAVVIGLNQHNSSTGGTTTTPTTTGETTDDETTTDDTYASSTTTSFDPSSLDDSGTDPTPLTVSALLPDEFTDSQGVTYTRRAAGVHDCLDNGESGTVRTVLSRVGCDQTVSGNYLDQEDKIMVWVVVVPLSDEQTADDAFTDLSGSSTDDWGIRCPHDGAGSAVCDASWDDINRATQYGYIRQDHRYLIHSIAIYADLGQNSDAEPWMDAASSSAVDTAGPENYQ